MEQIINHVAQTAYQSVRWQIHTSTSTADLIKVGENIHQGLDGLFARGLEATNSSIACCEGCFYCCHMKVDAFAHEVFEIVAFINKNFIPDRVAEVRRRATEYSLKFGKMISREQYRANLECPLLKDGRCSVYPVRPNSCKKFHSTSVLPCKRDFEHPEAAGNTSGEVMEIKQVLATYNVAVREAFVAEGFDAMPYELAGAIALALESPKPLKRWRSKKTAFPKELIAKDFREMKGL